MRTGTGNAEAIEDRHPQRPHKVPVRRPADLCFAKIIAKCGGQIACRFKQFNNGICSFERRAVDAAEQFQRDALVDGS